MRIYRLHDVEDLLGKDGSVLYDCGSRKLKFAVKEGIIEIEMKICDADEETASYYDYPSSEACACQVIVMDKTSIKRFRMKVDNKTLPMEKLAFC